MAGTVGADHPNYPPQRPLPSGDAGWLATVDWGTALAPIYKAFDASIPAYHGNQGLSLPVRTGSRDTLTTSFARLYSNAVDP